MEIADGGYCGMRNRGRYWLVCWGERLMLSCASKGLVWGELVVLGVCSNKRWMELIGLC